jgi:hypothetical protein
MMRTLEDVVGELRAGKNYSRPCSLLIGAGCSASAGIPTAAGFVELIKQEHPQAFARATEKSYSHCMAALVSGLRRDLIVAQINAAKINWAHVAIAQLIANGYVDRVLTTNFDPLVARACALVGQFPAVYDFAASTTFEPAAVAEKAVFHLHGQGTGFVLMNTEQECKEHCRRLGPLFQDAGRGRSWIVVGYSGDNDPVFSHLAAVTRFEYGLYWVGYLDAEPSRALREHLLIGGKQAYFVEGHDADSFFVELAQKLDCFPPKFIQRPFSHLRESFSVLTDFDLRKDDQHRDMLSEVRHRIDLAIEQYEQPSVETALLLMLMAGKYAEVEEVGLAGGVNISTPVASMVAAARFFIGGQLTEKAKSTTSDEADFWFLIAANKYAEAVDLKPDYHEALNNWGLMLDAQARMKRGEAADRLLQEAEKKYKRAVQIKPDKANAFVNWGNALAARAEFSRREAGDELFREAGKKYSKATELSPDLHVAFHNWGAALTGWARTQEGEAAAALFREASEKYAEAVRLKPDFHEALVNWSSMLLVQAQRQSGAEREVLLDQAEDKLKQAEALKAGSGAYNAACVAAFRGKDDECRRWLEVAREHGTLPDRAHLESDADLDPVRETGWFRDFAASL